jgi:hypothetical protein
MRKYFTTYVVVLPLALLEPGVFVGLLVPGEAAVVVRGVVAERGDVSLLLLVGLVWVAAGGGDMVGFLLGQRFARPFLESHGARSGIRPERVERLFDRHSGKGVLVGRFVGILRALTLLIAGASRFPLRRVDVKRPRSGESVTAMPITAIASETTSPGWNPSSSALALPGWALEPDVPASITAVDTARPIAPPTWNEVWTSPDASPCSWSATPVVAATLSGPKARVKPNPASRNVGSIAER